VDRPAAARQLLSQAAMPSDTSPVADTDSLEVEFSGTKEQIADANARLVAGGFKVYGIHPVNKSLEQTFLEMTGGGAK
jgi:hypothetical protein